MLPDVIAAHPNGGDLLAGASKRSVEHVAFSGSRGRSQRNLIHGGFLLRGIFLG
jgi:hypothetical protein